MTNPFSVGDRVRYTEIIDGGHDRAIAIVIGIDLLHVRLHWEDNGSKTYARAEHLELYFQPLEDTSSYLDAVT